VTPAELCALAQRVLGLVCTGHKRGDRYTLRHLPSRRGRSSVPGAIVYAGLTAQELRQKIEGEAAAKVDRIQRQWSLVYDERLALPAKHLDQREALARQQAAERERLERDYDECAKEADAAKALFLEIRAALGEGGES
jgi:hypothetical protein